jgi:UDP-glucuronate 4-epimerase
VTGAAGFLGRYVCAQLRRENLGYAGVDLHPPGAAGEGCTPCDITDRAAVAELFQTHKFEAVIHLAGMLPSACLANPAAATRINIVGSAHLLEAAAASGVARFVFGSSVTVYGSVGEGRVFSEQEPATPTGVYGAAKRYVEIYGEALSAHRAFSFVALRIATVVGAGARHTASPWRSEIFEKLASGSPQRITVPFGPDDVLSLVYVDDAARMLALLATERIVRSRIYNTPAENWPVAHLKRVLESLDANVIIEPDAAARRVPPPVCDGARFVHDFAWCAPSIADRLAARAGLRAGC